MKKNFLILIVTIFILTACNTPIKENKLKAKWTLDESLKPDITFTKSTDNDVNGIFYSEGQITYEEFRNNLLNSNINIDSLIHLGPHAFAEIGGEKVKTTTIHL